MAPVRYLTAILSAAAIWSGGAEAKPRELSGEVVSISLPPRAFYETERLWVCEIGKGMADARKRARAADAWHAKNLPGGAQILNKTPEQVTAVFDQFVATIVQRWQCVNRGGRQPERQEFRFALDGAYKSAFVRGKRAVVIRCLHDGDAAGARARAAKAVGAWVRSQDKALAEVERKAGAGKEWFDKAAFDKRMAREEKALREKYRCDWARFE